MKSTKYYFQHDYDSASDPKMTCLLSEHGGVGYGLYWLIVELLHKEPTHVIQKKPYLIRGLSLQMKVDEQLTRQIIDDCIKFELFKENEEGFWSERVLTNCKTMEEKKVQLSNLRKEVGRKGGHKSGEARRLNDDIF